MAGQESPTNHEVNSARSLKQINSLTNLNQNKAIRPVYDRFDIGDLLNEENFKTGVELGVYRGLFSYVRNPISLHSANKLIYFLNSANSKKMDQLLGLFGKYTMDIRNNTLF